MQFQLYLLKFYLIPFFILTFLLLTLFLIIRRRHYESFKLYKDNVTMKVENFLTEMILSNPDAIILNRKLFEFTNTIPFHKNRCK